MQQGGFPKVPRRYLFRERKAGTRRVGRRECSTNKSHKDQDTPCPNSVHLCPRAKSGNFTTDHLLKTSVALYKTALTVANVQEAIQQL